MAKCDKCGIESSTTYVGAFGYKHLCKKCHNECIEARDIKPVTELQNIDNVSTLNPEQLVKNFIKYFCEYKRNPSHELYNALRQIFFWSCHENKTVCTTIDEICKWQNFDWFVEGRKWHK